MNTKNYLSFGIFFLLSLSFLISQPRIALKPFASGFSKPVDIASAGDTRIFVVEQKGRILIVNSDGTVNSQPFLDIETEVGSNAGERGLLGLAFHPDYANNGFFYVNHTTRNGDTKVARYSVSAQNPDLANVNSAATILTQDQPFGNHNGGDLNFGPDGYLYIGFGDGGSGNDPQDNGQKKSTFLGKILRIDINNGLPYSVPSDNPFVGDATVLDEIWSLGWRNPWRFSFDRQTGDMWIGDVGQNAYEEISFEKDTSSGGLNYGWRCLEGNTILNPTGCATVDAYVAPVFDLLQGFNRGSSITGGYVYRGNDYPLLQGHYVFGDYASGQFWTLFPNENGGFDTTQQGKLFSRDRLSTFGEDKDGELYVAEHKDGIIYKVTETNVGIFPGAEALPVRMFPHPFKDQLQVEFDNPQGKSYSLRLLNSQGQMVRQIEDIRSSRIVLDRENLASGIYLIELRGKQLYSGKVLVE